MIDISVVFAAGSAYDDKQWGVASFTNAMLNEGTLKHSANQIATLFDSVGAEYSAVVGRDTATLSLRSLTKKSYLNPIWYLGSFGLAVFMQLQGQKKSKSFLAETERQVQTHLKKHLDIFPSEDNQARVILEKMYEDEGEHASWAENDSSGNDFKEELSKFEKHAMGVMSRVMIETSRRI